MNEDRIAKNLHGIWELLEFTNISEDRMETKWDGELTGKLVYLSNTVSVAINRWKKVGGELVEKHSFYSGRFKIINDKTVEHIIEQSPDITRIGSSHVRTFNLDNDLLVLEGKGLTGIVRLAWRLWGLT
jgi:hypothetical protein